MPKFEMIQTTAEKTCSNCGAEIRPDTQFCYNCGKILPEKMSQVESFNEMPESKNVELSPRKIQDSETVDRKNSGRQPKISERRIREKRQQKLNREVQIVWEEHDNPPNIIFIIGTVVLTVTALLLIYVMIRVR